MQDGTYPPRNFATFGPSGLQPPFTGTYKIKHLLIFFVLQHWAGVRLNTSFKISLSPVFLINSRYLLFFVTPRRVFLVPKLRNYFAEFLQLYFLVILIYSTYSRVSDFIRSFEESNFFSIFVVSYFWTVYS